MKDTPVIGTRESRSDGLLTSERQEPEAIAGEKLVTASPRTEVTPDGQVLLKVSGLRMHFPTGRGIVFRKKLDLVRAVDGVDLSIRRGETLGLVGESGSGKSTVGRAILQLHRVTSGSVVLDGVELVGLESKQMRAIRPRMQMIFQDPHASLNPRMTVGKAIGEVLEVHNLAKGKAKMDRVGELLELVGLNPTFSERYPHELSGGQRQRIGVARALALEPELIIADEPISALDVSIQAQIINLLEGLQDELGLTYLFIAHDLAVVRHISDRVAVMYLGKIVELAERADLYDHPLHPYTEALISAVPIPDPTIESTRERIILSGDIPSAMDPPSGCRFRTRCWKAQEICLEVEPPLVELAPGHLSACHFSGLSIAEKLV